MLPTDLLRARPVRGRLAVSYLKPKNKTWLEHAELLVETFDAHVGRSAGELREALKDIEGTTTKFKIARGLARILENRTESDTESPVDPIALREFVFAKAVERRPVIDGATGGDAVRSEVIEAAAAHFETTPDAVESGLYADLKDAQVIKRFDALEPPALLHRYNVSLAQTALLRATRLEILIALDGRLAAARFRQLFRFLKFFQLLHTIEPVESLAEGTGETYRIVVDGPMSVLKQSTRYGFQLACFLPALLQCPSWEATAELRWGTDKKLVHFDLSSDDGLVSHFKERGVYLSEEQQLFVDRFEQKQDEWELVYDAPLVPLGGQAMWIPDWRIRHKTDGREALMEIIGYWRTDYLARRMALLEAHGPRNLILGVSDRLKVDRAAVEALPVETIRFKRVLRTRDVVAALERVATVP